MMCHYLNVHFQGQRVKEHRLPTKLLHYLSGFINSRIPYVCIVLYIVSHFVCSRLFPIFVRLLTTATG